MRDLADQEIENSSHSEDKFLHIAVDQNHHVPINAFAPQDQSASLQVCTAEFLIAPRRFSVMNNKSHFREKQGPASCRHLLSLT